MSNSRWIYRVYKIPLPAVNCHEKNLYGFTDSRQLIKGNRNDKYARIDFKQCYPRDILSPFKPDQNSAAANRATFCVIFCAEVSEFDTQV